VSRVVRKGLSYVVVLMVLGVVANPARAASAPAPPHDFVVGGGDAGSFHQISINATSDPQGGDPSGTVSFVGTVVVNGTPIQLTFAGPVTCLGVVGNRALIGFQSSIGGPMRVVVVDNGSTGSPPDEFGVTMESTDCSGQIEDGDPLSGNIVVNDALSTHVVGNGDVSPNGAWHLEPTSNTGTYGFVAGPSPTPGGSGSLSMTVDEGQHEWLNNYLYGACATTPSCDDTASMTPVANFDALSFSAYRASGTTMPSFNIEVYTTGVDSYTTLAFVPDPGSVVDGTWQNWDAMNPSDGVWYSSRNVGNGVFNCAPFSCSASWSQVTASYPNAKVIYGLGPNVGTGGTFVGNVDNFTVGVSGQTKVYDFEPDCTTTCYVDKLKGDDNNTGGIGDPLATIQAAINRVEPGGIVQLENGTYFENVVVDKPVDIEGAGAGTIVEPAVSNPTCGGAGGDSLCAGASTVFLVQADNVTIRNLVVNGDSPLLTGLPVGGADIDARNGIITNHTLGTFNALTVDNVTVKNVYLRGIYASSGGTFTFTNNRVDNVRGAPQSIGIFNYLGSGTITGNTVSHTNDAISANHSRGTTFTSNTVTTSGSGVHTDNAGDSGGVPDSITGNSVSSCTAGGYGVWAFVPYQPVTISNNTVTGCDVGMAALASCNLAGSNNCPSGVIPTVTFTNNQITGNGAANGAGLYVTTNTAGFGDGDVKVSADHNTLSGAQDGVEVEETGTAHATTTVNRNSLAGISRALQNTGATTVDAQCNWWGQPTPRPLATGLAQGAMTVTPWLQDSDLNGNCVPVLTIGYFPVRVTEGNSGTTAATFALTLDRPNSVPVTLKWDTVDGTATAGSDFIGATNVPVTFNPGQTLQFVTVQVLGDTQIEAKEKFTLHLHATLNAVLANNTKHFTILNDDTGILQTWGTNADGELGNGSTTSSTSPHQVGTGTDWWMVSAGNASALALRADRSLWAWGDNSSGQLGDGTTNSHNAPMRIGTAINWASVSAGCQFSLGVKTDGSLWAWGDNSGGQLGDGTLNSHNAPVRIGTASDWRSVSAGCQFSLGIKTDGSLWAWGDNFYGMLGDGTTDTHLTPVKIGNATNWVSVAGGFDHSVGLQADGTLWAWGYNVDGELGDGTTTNQLSPEKIGTNTDWSSVSARGAHTMAIKTDGTLWAWGYNGFGELGDGTTSDQHSPEKIGTDTNWKSVSAGYYDSMAIKSDGTLWAWGENSFGQLGIGNSTGATSPVQIGSGTSWQSVAPGYFFGAAIAGS
jgi:alpha-tubulin suppressor-like RCC1 family protein/nitrous oxidase accessory protein NosD